MTQTAIKCRIIIIFITIAIGVVVIIVTILHVYLSIIYRSGSFKFMKYLML